MAIRLRTVVLVLVLFAVVLFAAINWAAFTQPMPINVVAGTVMAPLGIIMLAILGGVILLFSFLVARAETESLLGSRHAHREVDEARKLALDAEASRLTALRDEVREGLGSIDGKISEILRRVDAQGRVAVRQDATVPPPVARTDEPAV